MISDCLFSLDLAHYTTQDQPSFSFQSSDINLFAIELSISFWCQSIHIFQTFVVSIVRMISLKLRVLGTSSFLWRFLTAWIVCSLIQLFEQLFAWKCRLTLILSMDLSFLFGRRDGLNISQNLCSQMMAHQSLSCGC